MTVVMEHCDGKSMEHSDDKLLEYCVDNCMEHRDEKGMDYCDDRQHGAL